MVQQAIADSLVIQGSSQPGTPTGDDEAAAGCIDAEAEAERAAGEAAGLVNLGNTCYVNCLLQTYYFFAPLRDEILRLDATRAEEAPAEAVPPRGSAAAFIEQLQLLFARLALSRRRSVDPRSLLTHLFTGSAFTFGAEADATELNKLLISRLEAAVTGSAAAPRIASHLYGTMLESIGAREADGADASHEARVPFTELILPVSDAGGELRAALAELMRAESREFLTPKGHATTATKEARFVSLPSLLAVQLQRVGYDTLKQCAIKSHARFDFPLELDLAEHCAAHCAAAAAPRYALHALLLHSGEVTSGHYQLLVRGPAKQGDEVGWLRISDEHVSPVDASAVHAHGTGADDLGLGVPYCLYYAREGDAARAGGAASAAASVPSALADVVRIEDSTARRTPSPPLAAATRWQPISPRPLARRTDGVDESLGGAGGAGSADAAGLLGIDGEWIAHTMGATRGDARIVSVRSEQMRDTTHCVLMLDLAYEACRTGCAAAPPSSLVAKAFADDSGGPNREKLFYTKLARDLTPRSRELAAPIVPACYGAAALKVPPGFALLLQDLSPRALPGGQLNGASEAQARAVLRSLAALHAQWWGRAKGRGFEWLPLACIPSRPTPTAQCRSRLVQSFQRSWPQFAAAFSAHAMVPEAALRFGDGLVKKLPALLERFCKEPTTLIHGDCRVGNILFTPPPDGADGEVCASLVDFEFVTRGRAVLDVACFVCGSMRADVRRACEMDLLVAYHDELLRRGVRKYSMEALLADYRSAVLLCIVLPAFSAPEWVALAQRGGLLRGSPTGARFELACSIVHRITTAIAELQVE